LKRLLSIVIVALFVLGLAATAFAIHAEIPDETQAVVAKGASQITLGGNIRTRGEFNNNVTDFNSDADDRAAFYDQRLRLNVTAQVTANVTGYMSWENEYKWGQGGSTATGWYNQGNKRRGTAETLEGWILYKGDMLGLKVGHMPLALGNKLFFDHTKYGDDAIVVFADPAPGLHVAGLTIKIEDGANGNAVDQDAYVLLAAYTAENFGVSADVTNVKAGKQSSYATILEGLAGAPDGTGKVNLYNVGVRGNVSLGMVNLKADVEMQFGTLFTDDDTYETDLAGNAIMVGADAKLGGVNVGLEIGRGTGQEENESDATFFVTSLNSGVDYIGFVADTRAAIPGNPKGAGISNLTYVKLTAAAPVTDAVSLNGALLWMTLTEEVANEDAVGTEIDAKMTYKMARNLNYWIEGGYLMAGDAYGNDVDDAYAIRHGIELSF